MRYRTIKFRGSKMGFKDWVKLNKTFLMNRAPISYYKFFFGYAIIIFSVGFFTGVYSV